ncbi:MAG: hypothetical protein HY714_04780, partial [Candidatus Omnitrophica bacterium]|nr:hypothetical protein [Candidatus Omnitrophota bacterium]
VITGAEGTPKESTIATDIQSIVFFDVRGDKVLNALGFDKKGLIETLSAFYYWEDNTLTARREDKYLRKIKQWAWKDPAGSTAEQGLETYFGPFNSPNAVAGDVITGAEGTPKESTIPTDIQSIVFFDVRGDKVLNALGYDKKGLLETLSAFYYWEDNQATARKEDKYLRKIRQWAYKDPSATVSAEAELEGYYGPFNNPNAVAGSVVTGAEGTPKESAVATDIQSVVFFDVRGDKVLNALGYDKKGKLETLSAFFYWEDNATTARREDKYLRKIKQWAYKDPSAVLTAEKDLEKNYFGTEIAPDKFLPTANAGVVEPPAEGTPKESTVATDLQSIVFFDVRGDKVLNALGYDKKGKLETLSAFYYWEDNAATARREDKYLRKIKQWAYKDPSAVLTAEAELENYYGPFASPNAVAGDVISGAEGTPKQSSVATDLQSIVFFDVRGDKVLNALGYDKKGLIETLSAFYYWEDDTATARREDKYLRKIKQWAYKDPAAGTAEDDLETYFGPANSPNAVAGSVLTGAEGTPKQSSVAADIQSVVYFDVRGDKVLNSLGYDKKGILETLSAFYYWEDDTATARLEDKYLRKIKQWAYKNPVGSTAEDELENYFGTPLGAGWKSKPTAGTVVPVTEGTPKTSSVASDLQSIVFFDVRGDKVLNSLGYDKEGKIETLSAFYYWEDQTNTARHEDKFLRKIKQWATSDTEASLEIYFGKEDDPGKFLPKDKAGLVVPPVEGIPLEDDARDLQSIVFFDVRGDKVLNSLAYDKKGKLETMSAFYYWEDETATARREDKYLRKIRQWAVMDPSATLTKEQDLEKNYFGNEVAPGKFLPRTNAGVMQPPAEGIPAVGAAADLQSVVYFEATGDKVMNSLGFDKEGKIETLSAFYYWVDNTSTARREDKFLRRIDQWATNVAESALDTHFGPALATANAKNEVRYTGTDWQSKVYFDNKGDKVLNSIGFDKLNRPESLSAFYYWEDDTATPRHEDKWLKRIDQYAFDQPDLESYFGTDPLVAPQTPKIGDPLKDMQSQVLFESLGDKVAYTLGYDNEARLDSLTVFHYWDDDTTTSRREDKFLKALDQYAYGGPTKFDNYLEVPRKYEEPEAAVWPADSDMTSNVYFDKLGDKVLYSVGFDNSGRSENLVRFNYWEDNTGTARREDKWLKRLDQFAFEGARKFVPTLNGVRHDDYTRFRLGANPLAEDPAFFAANNRTSTVYFDTLGDKVMRSIGHDPDGNPENVSQFFYWTDRPGPRREDKWMEHIQQNDYEGALPDDINGDFTTGTKDLKSKVFFDEFGKKAMYSYAYEDNKLKNLSVFKYQSNDPLTSRHEDNWMNRIQSYKVKGNVDVGSPAFDAYDQRRENLIDQAIMNGNDELTNIPFFDRYGQRVMYSHEYTRSRLSGMNAFNYQEDNTDTYRREDLMMDNIKQHLVLESPDLNFNDPKTRTFDNVKTALETGNDEHSGTIYFDKSSKNAMLQISYDEGKRVGMTVFHYQTNAAGKEIDRINYVRSFNLKRTTAAVDPKRPADRGMPAYRTYLDGVENQFLEVKDTESYFNVKGRKPVFNYSYKDNEREAVSVFNYQSDDPATDEDEGDRLNYMDQFNVKEYTGAITPGAWTDRVGWFPTDPAGSGVQPNKSEIENDLKFYRESRIHFDEFGEKAIYTYGYRGRDTNGDGVKDQSRLENLSVFEYREDNPITPKDERNIVNSLSQFKVIGNVDIGGTATPVFDTNLKERTRAKVLDAIQAGNDELSSVSYFAKKDAPPIYVEPVAEKYKEGEKPVYSTDFVKRDRDMDGVAESFQTGTSIMIYQNDNPATMKDESQRMDRMRQYTVVGEPDVYTSLAAFKPKAGDTEDELATEVFFDPKGEKVMMILEYQNKKPKSFTLMHYQVNATTGKETSLRDFSEQFDLELTDTPLTIPLAAERNAAWVASVSAAYQHVLTGRTYFDSFGDEALYS